MTTTKNMLNALVYAVLGALKASRDNGLGGTPNGHMYAQLMDKVDIGYWNKLVEMLVVSELVTQSNYLLKITDKGVALYDKLDVIIKDAEKR